MNYELLKGKYLDELKTIAKSYGVANISKYKKDELISEILKADSANEISQEESKIINIEETENIQVKNDSEKKVFGIIDITHDGYGFLRSPR